MFFCLLVSLRACVRQNVSKYLAQQANSAGMTNAITKQLISGVLILHAYTKVYVEF